MIAIFDAAYGATRAAIACVEAQNWTDDQPSATSAFAQSAAAPYEPGAFYKRELPLLLRALARLRARPEMLVIDGYVWLDAHGRPGLGAHLHRETDIPVVGVAKTAFRDAQHFSTPVLRGASAKPLFVTAAGMDATHAAARVRAMHGNSRIPTLLKTADTLARATLSADE
ncbi:MAG: endonuclease V [Alphaproteobacteria bacterium]|nr:endonuclease V [Alphaproteobacteria bacterium]